VGVDNIDADAATRRGVVVMNTPGANAVAVAELTIGLMLALARKVPAANASMHAASGRRRVCKARSCAARRWASGLGALGWKWRSAPRDLGWRLSAAIRLCRLPWARERHQAGDAG